MFRRLAAAWGTKTARPVRPIRRLRLEGLEAREVPTVSLAPILDQQVANNAPTYIPLTVTNTPTGNVAYDVTSSDAAVTASLLPVERSVRFTVTGLNADGSRFTGDIVIRLFESTAPRTTARIIELVNNGFYINKTFHRVERTFGNVDETIIQGGSSDGNGIGGSGLGELPDEFSADFRFHSAALVASANRGDDTTDSQFFIDRASTPLPNRPQFLNFNYTIFGILTSGADIYERMRNTTLNGTRPVPDPSFDASLPNLRITAATVFADNANGVLKVETQAGYTGTARVQVTPRDLDGPSPVVSTQLTGVTANPSLGNPPFLGAIPANLTTQAGQSVTFSVPVTDVDGSPLTIDVRNSTFTAAPQNVTVSINQSTRTVTLTPAAGFTGQIVLRVGVRDNVDRSGTGTLDTASNFDTQVFTLTVNSAAPQATVGLTSDVSTVATGSPVRLTATVSASGVSSPAGTVEFRSGNTLLATAAVSNGTATTTQTFGAAGTQTLTATFVPADATVVRGNTSAPIAVTITTSPEAGPFGTTTTLSATPASPTIGQTVTLTAAVVRSGAPDLALAGVVDFLRDGTVVQSVPLANDGTATTTLTFPAEGTFSLTATYRPADGSRFTTSTSLPTSLTVATTIQPPITQTGVTAQGSAAGSAPRVTVFNADGSTRISFLAFEESFTGGIRTAVADVTGDGVPDIVVVPGFGGGPVVRVFDTTTGAILASKTVFEESFRGGLTLATGDTGSLNYSRVAIGAGEGGGPRVLLMDFRTNTTILDFVAYSGVLRGGVSVSMGVLPGGTGADLVTGVGAGGGPQINVYDGATGILMGATQVGDGGDRNGIGVRVAPVPPNTANTIYAFQLFGSGRTETPLNDLSWIDFTAPTKQQTQQNVQDLLTGGGTSTTQPISVGSRA